MKRIRKYITIFTLPCLFIGCHDKNKSLVTEETSQYFIKIYIEADELLISQSSYKGFISGEFEGNSYDETYVTRNKFEYFAQKYKDLSYNSFAPPGSSEAVCNDFLSVDMSCEQEIDINHPAGASVGDIVKLRAVSAYEYINSGYKTFNAPYSELFNQMHYLTQYGYSHIYKFLDEIEPIDLILLKPAYFYFEMPEDLPAGTYDFTVTFTSEHSALSKSVTYVQE